MGKQFPYVVVGMLMFAILLLRPRGLFGERWERFE